MKLYQPRIRVTLIKVRSRDYISGTSQPSSERYKDFRILDLTPYLADGGVRTQKSVREPAGAFSISLTTRPHPTYLETLDMLIEPMDLIEIRMAHDAPGPDVSAEDRKNWPPVLMRGFVSQIAKSESIANGAPQRSITISGQDYGKVWQMASIYYYSGTVNADNKIHNLSFFDKFLTANEARIMDASEFLETFVNMCLKPYIEAILSLATGKPSKPLAAGETVEQRRAKLQERCDSLTADAKAEEKIGNAAYGQALQHRTDIDAATSSGDTIGAAIAKSEMDSDLAQNKASNVKLDAIMAERTGIKKEIDQLESDTTPTAGVSFIYPNPVTLKCSLTGRISPFGVGNAQDMTFYQLLATFLDVGAFNELYIEDVGPDVIIVARPQPAWWPDLTKFVDTDVFPEAVKIGLGDVASMQLSRGDAGVYNFYEVESVQTTVYTQAQQKLIAVEEKHGNPFHFSDLNSEAAYFGERRMKVVTKVNAPDSKDGDGDYKEKRAKENEIILTWLGNRRQRIVDLNTDASVLERGSLRLKGNEKLRAGMMLHVVHSSAMTVTYYVPSVSQEYIPGSGFFTTAQVERGNGFVLSSQIKKAPDLSRRDLGGVK
ncbi:hypothetical protein [Propionivibrio sp.]|uniref:hypothetical protein n=1 Tax=Propionivibrio sp. TaxID=2212460 RepID=UPI003BF1162B